MSSRHDANANTGLNRPKKDSRVEVLLFLGILFLLVGLLPEKKEHAQARVAPSTLCFENHQLVTCSHRPDEYDKKLPAELTPFLFEPIPINSSSAELLETIPGIGKTLSSDIVKYRQNSGLFEKPRDLLQVKGVGEKRLAMLRKHVSFQ
ncbi:MAG: helix-hairpin-helix domain-containing protein [Thermodesulfobacteriota bacterium]